MGRAYCIIHEQICPVCGKLFIKQPEHVYKITKRGHVMTVCSWKCMRSVEKK